MTNTVQSVRRVKIRFPQVSGLAILRTADVLSAKGDMLRVKVEGEFQARDVRAADTVPVTQASGRLGERPVTEPQKQYPASHHALANMI